jgi:hypothetical protein
MITVKDAVNTALQYAQELFKENAVLEEVELDDSNNFWLITLSFEDVNKPVGILSITPRTERRYKLFKVDANTSQVVSAKIRKI